jgi:hypothetical protein
VELFEFSKILKEIGDYYERTKEPRHGTIDLWFDKVKHIPTEPIPWIVSKIEADNESFPRNLPATLWGAFREWMQMNPDKVACVQTFRECPDCSEGLIWARMEKNGHRYTYVFRCARCKQSTVQAYPIAHRMELVADYDVIPKNGDPYNGAVRARNVQVMAQYVGRTI